MVEINISKVVIGLGAVGYGIFTFIVRNQKPDFFGKLEPMKRFFGEKLGY